MISKIHLSPDLKIVKRENTTWTQGDETNNIYLYVPDESIQLVELFVTKPGGMINVDTVKFIKGFDEEGNSIWLAPNGIPSKLFQFTIYTGLTAQATFSFKLHSGINILDIKYKTTVNTIWTINKSDASITENDETNETQQWRAIGSLSNDLVLQRNDFIDHVAEKVPDEVTEEDPDVHGIREAMDQLTVEVNQFANQYTDQEIEVLDRELTFYVDTLDQNMDAKKVDKSTAYPGEDVLYSRTGADVETVTPVKVNTIENGVVPKYDSTGTLSANNPTANTHVVNKQTMESNINAHNTSPTSHLDLRDLISDLDDEIARLDGKGRSYGEIAATQSVLEGLSQSARNTNINNDIAGRFPGYTPSNGDLIYTKEASGQNVHEWEYNSPNWVDNGAYTVQKASNTTFGLIKGGNSYISVAAGLVSVLLSDYATRIGTSGANYTYANLQSLFNDRYTKSQVDGLLNNLKAIYGWSESELARTTGSGAKTISKSLFDTYDFVLLTYYNDTKSDSLLIKPDDMLNGRVWESNVTDVTFTSTDVTFTNTADGVFIATGIEMKQSTADEIAYDLDRSVKDALDELQPIVPELEFKNLAMPDLTGKTEISAGVYRLYNADGITIDYNLNNGEYIINGTADGFGTQYLTTSPIIEAGQVVSRSIYYVSGYTSSGLDNSMTMTDTSKNSIIIDYNNNKVENTITDSTVNGRRLIFWIGNGRTFDNFTFKLQIEKGSTATLYTKPQTPDIVDRIDKLEVSGIDVPIKELNNNTLRRVFEDGNLIINGDFSDGDTGFGINSAIGSVTNGIYSFTATTRFGRINQNVPVINTNKYYVASRYKTVSPLVRISRSGDLTPSYISHSGSGNYELVRGILTATTTGTVNLQISDWRESDWTQTDVDYIYFIDLTSLGISHLTVEQMDKWFDIYNKIINGGLGSILNDYVNKPFRSEFNGYNLAMPDLTGKSEISTGVYRLWDSNGITIDYNVNNGEWKINGTVTSGFSIGFTNNITQGILTAQLIHISGSVSTASDGWRFADNVTGSGRIYWNGFEGYTKTKLKQETDLQDIRFNFLSSSSFNNFQFKLQLEKGSVPNGYTIPSEIPQYATKTQEEWITPTLLNGATGTVQYRKNQFGRVELRGYVIQITAGSGFMQLPIGYHMNGSKIGSGLNYTALPVITEDGIIGMIRMTSSGSIYGLTSMNNKVVSLNNITWIGE